VSLSAISSLSISQSSLFDEPSPTTQTSGTSNAESTSGTSANDALANDLGTLLNR
jgi:hypothetical protein